MTLKAINPEVYVAEDTVVRIGAPLLKTLEDRVHDTERKRVRVCAHKDVSDKLHEMFVVYVKETYVRPNKHLGKDESLHIIRGAADFIFFDEDGNMTDVVFLGEYGSDREFYCRVPQNVWHTLIIRSDEIVIHEATPGPFRREDTLFADWGPLEGDTEAVGAFIDTLESGIADFKAANRA